jgi:hypothetical protein
MAPTNHHSCDQQEAAMNAVLMRIAASEHLTRQVFVALAELMPAAVSVGASLMGLTCAEFLCHVNSGSLRPLPVLLGMARHIEASETAH